MPYKDQGKWRGVVKISGQRVAQRRFDTKREARNWEVEERNRLKRIETGMDFETFANEYLDRFEERRGKNSTYYEKVRVAKRFIRFIRQDTLIDEVSTTEIEKYLGKQKTSRSASASNKDRKELFAMWNWGVKHRGLKSNPVTLTERFPHDEKPQYTPPERDVLRVVASSSGVDRVFLECYLQTGARRSEIFKLKWEDVNFERGTITLYTRKSRDGSLKSRTLPMNKRLQDALRWWWHNRTFENEPWVFVDDHPGVHIGKPYKVRRRFLKSLCEKAKVKRFGFHGLRRFVASVLSDKYMVSTPTIQNILGHEKPTTTDRYIKRIAGDMQQAMDMLAEGQDFSEINNKKGDSDAGHSTGYPRDRHEKNVALGERHGRAKLTEEQVLRINSDTNSSHAALAREFNVSEKAIRLIRQGINWKSSVPQSVPQTQKGSGEILLSP